MNLTVSGTVVTVYIYRQINMNLTVSGTVVTIYIYRQINMNLTVSGTVVTVRTDTKHELHRLRHCGYYTHTHTHTHTYIYIYIYIYIYTHTHTHTHKTWTYPNRICLCVSPDSRWILRWTLFSRLVFVIETECLLWRGCWDINLIVEKMPKAASSTAKERVVCRHILGSNWGRYSVDNHYTLLHATSDGTATDTVETHRQTEQDRLRYFGTYVVRWAIWWEFLNEELEDEHRIGLSPTNFVSIENRLLPPPQQGGLIAQKVCLRPNIPWQDGVRFSDKRYTPNICRLKMIVKWPLDSLHIIGTVNFVSGGSMYSQPVSQERTPWAEPLPYNQNKVLVLFWQEVKFRLWDKQKVFGWLTHFTWDFGIKQ